MLARSSLSSKHLQTRNIVYTVDPWEAVGPRGPIGCATARDRASYGLLADRAGRPWGGIEDFYFHCLHPLALVFKQAIVLPVIVLLL